MAWRDVLIKTAWVGLGGFLGANARYWIGGWVQARLGVDFPWATFLINISGSFLLGLFITVANERFALPASAALRLAFAIGFVGAYTTFSTFEMETLTLAATGVWIRAFANAFGSLAAGFVAVWLGVVLGRVV